MSAISPIQSAAATTDPISSATATAGKDITNKNTFLQLLIAQLQNQDPLKPQDGAEFVTQLAQFSNLEQQIASREDLDAIRQALATSGPGATGASATTGTTKP
jgi:flagellar basal-body rod modification protein FlgD